MLSYENLDRVAGVINPLLLIIAVFVPGFRRSFRGWGAVARYYLASGLGVAVVYLVAWIDQRFGLWARFGHDYSTHAGFAMSIGTSIVCWDRRWTLPMIGFLLGYGALILYQRYAGVVDLLSTVAVALPSTWGLHLALGSAALREEA